jgi:SAM-dependent methyltransferase
MPDPTDSEPPLDPAWQPPEIDISKPSVARVYDVFLDGKDNYEIDRQAAKMMSTALPEIPLIARINRHVLARGVRYLVREAGIRQIVDIGSGLPTAGNIHQIAHAIDPDVSVVYVDNDPIVLAHGRALLAENDRTTVIQADVRDADVIFGHDETRAYIDFDEPFAVLLGGVLHSLPAAASPAAATAAIRAHLRPGCHFMITNFTDTGDPIVDQFNKATIAAGFDIGKFSTTDDLRSFFDGLEIIEPGIVPATTWHPDDQPDPAAPTARIYYAGMARKE